MAVTKYHTKQGIRYRARFELDGVAHREAGFQTRDEAQTWILDEKRRLLQPQPQQVTNGGLAWLANKYLDHCAPRYTKNTTRYKRTILNKLALFAKQRVDIPEKMDVPLDLVTQDLIEDYLTTFEKPTTANVHLKDIRACFSWGARRGHCDNVASNVDELPAEEYVPNAPPRADVLAVIMKAGSEERDFLQLQLHTGARPGEIMQLKKGDVDLKRGTILLWTKKRKGGERQWRRITLTNQAKKILKRRMDEHPDTPWALTNPRTLGPYQRNQHFLKHMMTRLCRAAEVPRFTHHALRHHAASALIAGKENGQVSLKEISEWLGHQRVSTTDLYLHRLGDDDTAISDFFNSLDRDESL